MGMMEKEFSGVDENDPKAMARMMRKMSEATGEKIDGEMEEVVRKLEEGADPDSLEEQLGGPNHHHSPQCVADDVLRRITERMPTKVHGETSGNCDQREHNEVRTA